MVRRIHGHICDEGAHHGSHLELSLPVVARTACAQEIGKNTQQILCIDESLGQKQGRRLYLFVGS